MSYLRWLSAYDVTFHLEGQLSQKPSMFPFLNCEFEVISTIAKVASLPITVSRREHGPWKSTWSLVSASAMAYSMVSCGRADHRHLHSLCLWHGHGHCHILRTSTWFQATAQNSDIHTAFCNTVVVGLQTSTWTSDFNMAQDSVLHG